MPSFDVSSEIDWQELDNAVNQSVRELQQRYDFKGVPVEITLDQKLKIVTLLCGAEAKLDAMVESFHGKLIKRGLSLLSFEAKDPEPAFGGRVRQVYAVQNGVSKEKGKEIIGALKESKLKVQAQMQDEQVRVTGKNRDDLQMAIAYLKQQQNKLKIPMQFGNFRE